MYPVGASHLPGSAAHETEDTRYSGGKTLVSELMDAYAIHCIGNVLGFIGNYIGFPLQLNVMEITFIII